MVSVVLLPEFNNFWKVKFFVVFPLTGKGIVSVTNIRLVRTGIAASSPSAQPLPELLQQFYRQAHYYNLLEFQY
ncbi:MAG: hypothetical protein WKF59_06370 [Chitinophagaceae bacterium]